MRTHPESRGDAPYILGISASHNGAACLIHGEHIVCAIQEERLTRKKRQRIRGAEPAACIRYCLETAAIDEGRLDLIVVCPQKRKDRAVHDAHLNPLLRPTFHDTPVLSVSHHYAHAASAFCTSGFDDAAILVVDGIGSTIDDLSAEERAVICESAAGTSEALSMYQADRGRITAVYKEVIGSGDWLNRSAWLGVDCPAMPTFGSLGGMFGAVATQIFGDETEAGKVMGLAPYGTPRFPVSEFFELSETGLAWTNRICERFRHSERWPSQSEAYSDLAASVQRALEEALVWELKRLRRLTASRNLCFAGGVALNSVANQRVVERAGFDNVFIIPAAEDSGPAIGAAYHGLRALTGRLASKRIRSDALGRSYSSAEIEGAIASAPAVLAGRPADLNEDCVRALTDGKIVAWWSGRSEFGPRALGHRSILLDPRLEDGKEILNSRVKFREAFRPFAVSVLQEHMHEWFQMDCTNPDSPFMLRVFRWRADRPQELRSVVHVDGTARVQTVNRDDEPVLHRLLEMFHVSTGVPMLLNTSFNVMGEPIVETPDEALWALISTDIDLLYLDGYRVNRLEHYRSVLDLVPIITAESVAKLYPRPGSRPGLCAPCEVSFRIRDRWGDHERAVPANEYLPILERIDGKLTAREIVATIQAEDCGGTTAELTQRLQYLRRIRSISFKSPEPKLDALANASKVSGLPMPRLIRGGRSDPRRGGHGKRIAVCGIDGSGKTSLIRALCNVPELRQPIYLKKHTRTNIERLTRLHAAALSDPWSFVATSHVAEQIGWATWFDFLSYYRQDVLAVKETARLQLLDRWLPCLYAFTSMAPGLSNEIERLGSHLHSADAVVYVDVEPEVAYARITAHRAPVVDEAPVILEALHDAYERVLSQQDAPILRVKNEAFIDTFNEIARFLIEFCGVRDA